MNMDSRDALKRMRSATELDVMRMLKRALDPRDLLNPGKIGSVASLRLTYE